MPFGFGNAIFLGAHVDGTPPSPETPPGSTTNVSTSDNLAAIQTALNSVTAGNSLVFASGTYNLGGNLIGKNGITLWSNGGSVITNGDFDFSGKSGWTIRGVRANQTATTGFTFSGTSRINAGAASGSWAIKNCTFLNSTLRPASGQSAGSDGSAIYYPSTNPNTSTDHGLIKNCNFVSCQGVAVGSALNGKCNNIVHDGLQFLACRQPSSLQFSINDPTFGTGIEYRRCAFDGTTRTCLEFGPNSNGPEIMNDLVCDSCWFGNFNHAGAAPGDGTLIAVSFVALGSHNTTVTNNYINLGPTTPNIGWIAPAIEIAGTGTCAFNTTINFTYAALVYGAATPTQVHDNVAWNTNNFLGWSNNGGQGVYVNNVSHNAAFPGPIPPYPARILP